MQTALNLPPEHEGDDPDERLYMNLLLGHLQDLAKMRDEALKSYHQVLALPNLWLKRRGSCHKAAQKGIKKQFTQDDVMKQYQAHLFYPVMTEHRAIQLIT